MRVGSPRGGVPIFFLNLLSQFLFSTFFLYSVPCIGRYSLSLAPLEKLGVWENFWRARGSVPTNGRRTHTHRQMKERERGGVGGWVAQKIVLRWAKQKNNQQTNKLKLSSFPSTFQCPLRCLVDGGEFFFQERNWHLKNNFN